jgi:hypothetical protein
MNFFVRHKKEYEGTIRGIGTKTYLYLLYDSFCSSFLFPGRLIYIKQENESNQIGDIGSQLLAFALENNTVTYFSYSSHFFLSTYLGDLESN